MFAFLTSFNLFLAEGAYGASGGFMKFYQDYLNIPGFELWKFINLAIFIAIAVYIGKKKLTPSFIAKRDQIRAELIKAEDEKQAALSKLATAEAKLISLEAEKTSIIQKAKEEAAAEKARIAEQTRIEAERLRQQTEADLSRLGKQTQAELRRFSAEESIRLAEAKLRAQIDGEKDGRLVKASIQEIGGLN